MLSTHLDACYAPSNPFWHLPFWQAVHAWVSGGIVPSSLVDLLRYYGYIGSGTSTPPRMPELREGLTGFVNSPVPSGGAYRSLRQRGHSSVRDYLAQNLNGDRTSGTWSDLWTLAVQLDYSIASAHRMGGDEGVFRSLASSDECEIGLRRLAAFISEDRAHDSVAARIIQGSAPPGAKVDIAPNLAGVGCVEPLANGSEEATSG